MSNLLDLLIAGKVDEFNASRGQRRRVELFAVELAEASLVGVDLSNATLEKSDLTSADLTDANLTKADLTGVDASEAKLCDVMAVGVKLREAFLDQADLAGADLSHGDLSEAVLTNASLNHAKLSNAKLRETDLTSADLTGADLTEARLHKANLTDANLDGADLSEATAQECVFANANMAGIIALRARLQGSNLTNTNLLGARLEEANLQGCDLSGANLERADLRRANLTGAKLDGANLRGANLADAVLEGVNLADLDMADVDLTGVDHRALGLSEEQIGKLAAVGASAAAQDAPLRFTDVAVARTVKAIAVFWENADSDETLSLRFAVFPPGKKAALGVLPVSAEGVMARAVVPAAPDAPHEFELFVLQERPGGVALLRYGLGVDGALGPPKVFGLGYEPGVRPVVRIEGGVPTIWGLARRGPTLVIQKVGGDELETVHSEKLATARGFLGGHHAVLACKGGVVIPAGPKGAAEPLRTPSTFPGRLTAAVPVADKLIVVWLEDFKSDDEPGGLRHAALVKGPAPKTRVLTVNADVSSIDALDVAGGGAWVGWTEIAGPAICRLPDGEPERLEIDGGDEFEELRFAFEAPGTPGLPVVALTTADEGLVVVDLDGRVLARFEGQPL